MNHQKETPIVVYQKALEKALIGGNSLASALISMKVMPSTIKSIEEAQRMHGNGSLSYVEYECWLCWHCLMEARQMIIDTYPEPGTTFEE